MSKAKSKGRVYQVKLNSTPLKCMPCGKWQGVTWGKIPSKNLRAILEWWQSNEAPRISVRELIIESASMVLGNRMLTPDGRKPRRRRRGMNGRPRSAVVVKTRRNR